MCVFNPYTIIFIIYDITYVWMHSSTYIIINVIFIHVCISQHVTQGDMIGYQVYYDGTMINVNSSTTTLTFTAPSLPDDVFTSTVVVMVTATNRYGTGPTSQPQAAVITGN